MKSSALKIVAGCLFGFGIFAGCESEGGNPPPQASTGYYSTAAYDPWYHGEYDAPDEIVTVPPGSRPEAPPRPAHPIALPPAPRQQPMPGIPMRPRPAFRR